MTELLVAGHCVQLERFVRRGGAWRSIEFPSLVALLDHPDGGVVLYDTGYAPRFHTATARWPYQLYARLLPVTCGPADSVLAQLAERDLAPGDVRLIVLSHLHGDHVAGLLDFTDARIVVGPGELPPDWRKRSAWRNAAHALVPDLLPADVEQRLLSLDELALRSTGLGGLLEVGHDLFGDDSALVVRLPGHTPGQLGLWLPAEGSDGLLLVGDAVWHRRAFTHGELPLRVLRADRERYEAIVAELARVHAERPHLQILPSHCPASIAEARGYVGG